MSPIDDPRHSKARWREAREADREESQRAARVEYVKPLIVLPAAVLVGLLLAIRGAHGAAAVAVAGYFTWLGLAVGVGMAGLLISARLFLGGAGPAGLAVLRLAAALAGAHVVWTILPLGGMLNVGVAGLAFVGLVVWLFDMDLEEAALLGLVILVLVIALSVALAFVFPPP
jgi:hypothetical protein